MYARDLYSSCMFDTKDEMCTKQIYVFFITFNAVNSAMVNAGSFFLHFSKSYLAFELLLTLLFLCLYPVHFSLEIVAFIFLDFPPHLSNNNFC